MIVFRYLTDGLRRSLFDRGDPMRFVKVSGMLLLCCAGAAMAQAPTFQPVGTVRQVMLGIVKPTSDVVFKFQFDPPKTDDEWMTLRNNALNLAEAGNLLLLPGRAKDKGEWTKNAKALIATGSDAFKAANAKDSKALEQIGDKIDETCEACHAIYLPKPPQ
jgi:hypothetical protein